VVSNGNLRCAHDLESAIHTTGTSCVGVMSAEGLLRNPCLFMTHNGWVEGDRADGAGQSADTDADDSDLFTCPKCNAINRRQGIPDMYTLFENYCALSEKYRELGGWSGMDEYELSTKQELKQIYIARQHLTWFLGKEGHGRTVRFKNLGACYKRHSDLLKELAATSSIESLLLIARKCLVGIWT
jgi:tRNA-dihydrouridine synthase